MSGTTTVQPAEVLRKLLASWSGYDPGHDVVDHEISRGIWYVGYFSCPESSPYLRYAGTHLTFNIGIGKCYMMSIAIDFNLRGRGLGRQLYEIAEEFAREMGCHIIECTPSGTTRSGSRADYMRRIGWTLRGYIAFKELTQ